MEVVRLLFFHVGLFSSFKTLGCCEPELSHFDVPEEEVCYHQDGDLCEG